jgi:galactitol-specific phosphotransferase system IIB component
MTDDVKALKDRIAELEANQTKIKNIKTEVDKNGILTIEIDLTKDFGKSKSGKTIVVASTGGFAPIPDWKEGFALNLNVVKK